MTTNNWNTGARYAFFAMVACYLLNAVALLTFPAAGWLFSLAFLASVAYLGVAVTRKEAPTVSKCAHTHGDGGAAWDALLLVQGYGFAADEVDAAERAVNETSPKLVKERHEAQMEAARARIEAKRVLHRMRLLYRETMGAQLK